MILKLFNRYILKHTLLARPGPHIDCYSLYKKISLEKVKTLSTLLRHAKIKQLLTFPITSNYLHFVNLCDLLHFSKLHIVQHESPYIVTEPKMQLRILRSFMGLIILYTWQGDNG